MSKELSKYESIAEAIVILLQPDVEVVIHDLRSDRITYIANPVSGRKVGEPSYLDTAVEELEKEHGVIGPYEKAGKKGQRLRSVTTVLRDDQGSAIGLMCINLDYSRFVPALELLESLIRPATVQQPPDLLFKDDWRERVKLEIRYYLEKLQLPLNKLTSGDRQALLGQLDKKRLLYARNSIEQIASILQISRATAYNDLKISRKCARRS